MKIHSRSRRVLLRVDKTAMKRRKKKWKQKKEKKMEALRFSPEKVVTRYLLNLIKHNGQYGWRDEGQSKNNKLILLK